MMRQIFADVAMYRDAFGIEDLWKSELGGFELDN